MREPHLVWCRELVFGSPWCKLLLLQKDKLQALPGRRWWWLQTKETGGERGHTTRAQLSSHTSGDEDRVTGPRVDGRAVYRSRISIAGKAQWASAQTHSPLARAMVDLSNPDEITPEAVLEFEKPTDSTSTQPREREHPSLGQRYCEPRCTRKTENMSARKRTCSQSSRANHVLSSCCGERSREWSQRGRLTM